MLIIRQFEWSYVSVVYSDSEYGDHGYETLVSLAGEYSICFSAPQRISQDRFTIDDYDNVVRTIAEKTEVRGDFLSFKACYRKRVSLKKE